ncbi:hypothetical protein V2W45_1466168 [Cenococcum geophilum]
MSIALRIKGKYSNKKPGLRARIEEEQENKKKNKKGEKKELVKVIGLNALIIAYIFSTLRISEYVEFIYRLDLDIIFTIFYNKCGNIEFAIQLQQDVKYITFTLDKRAHVIYKGVKTYPLFCNLILIIVAIYIARNAFRDYKLIDEGFRAGYNEPLMVYNFRAEGLILTGIYTDIKIKQGGQRDPAVYRNYYAANNAGQSLPAEKRHKLKQSAEFKDIKAKLKDLSLDDALLKNKRKELQARKQKLISEALYRYRGKQPTRPASKVDAYIKECTGRYRTIFRRARKLIPVRDHLASSIFIKATIYSDIGKTVLQDLIKLYL